MIDIIIHNKNKEKLLHTIESLDLSKNISVTIIDNFTNETYDDIINDKITVLRTDCVLSNNDIRNFAIKNTTNSIITFVECGDTILTNNLFEIVEDEINNGANIVELSIYEESSNYQLILNNMNKILGKFYSRMFIKMYNILFNPDAIEFGDNNWIQKTHCLTNKILEFKQYPFAISRYNPEIKTFTNDKEYFCKYHLKDYSNNMIDLIEYLDSYGVDEEVINELVIEGMVTLYYSYYAISNLTNEEVDLNDILNYYNTIFVHFSDKLNPQKLIEIHNNILNSILNSNGILYPAVTKFNKYNFLEFVLQLSK